MRSDMSRFHHLEIEDITAHVLFSRASRLAAYGGVLAARIREEQQMREDEAESIAHNVVAFEGTRDAVEANPMFAGLGAFHVV